MQIIKDLGLNLHTVNTEHKENYPRELAPHWVAPYLAEQKGRHYNKPISENEILLTADTVVIHKEKILEKPAKRAEAIEMLSRLSGEEHLVMSAVSLRGQNKKVVFSDCSRVFFDEIRLQDIEYYVDKWKPFDKAGAYGIQEWLGSVHIRKIEGSYPNIVGLPTHKLMEHLTNWHTT